MTCVNAECLLATFAVVANAPPLMPDELWGKVWLSFGWSVVLAVIGFAFVQTLAPASLRKLKGCGVVLATVLALWCWLPGLYGASFWFGLAFQSPSIATVGCCGAFLWTNRARLWAVVDQIEVSPTINSVGLVGTGAGVAAGIVLGWVLLLDTLGVWPVSVYSWGFHPAAAPLAILITGIAWMVGGARCPPSVGILAVCGTALFVTLRLPTGNLWDALLDPLLWVVLHWMGLRWLWARKWGRS